VESLRGKSRIHITGNAGSGKSTLAKQLSNELDLPLFGLDNIVWQPGWKQTPIEERRAKELQIAEKTKWIVEGVSPTLREHADVIIFLDVPRRKCLWRCAKRNLPYLFRSRPGLPEDCPEYKIIPRLVNIIWNFRRLAGVNILADMEKYDREKTIIHIRQNENAFEQIAELA